MNTKKEYVAPTLTVVTFKVEQGFAASTEFRLFQDFQLFNEDYNNYYNNQAQENWEEPDNNYFGTIW